MVEPTSTIDGIDVADVAMDGVVVSRGSDIVYANDTLAEILGYESGRDLVGKQWEDLLSPTEDTITTGEMLSAVRDSGEWRGQAVGQKGDGDTVPVKLSARNVDDSIVWIARDLSGRQEQERKIEQYETILDTVDDGVYVLNENLRVETANERFFEMMTEFGFSREEVRQMHAHDLVKKENERAALEAEIERAIESESHIGSFEMSAETPKGDTVVCESRFRLYPEPRGEHRGCIGILRDITDRKERARQLKRQRDELDTLNRINELLLTVSRDLFESPIQGDIEQTVCDRLADSDLYQFAWIGKPEVDGNRLVPTASAGMDDDYLESITVTTDDRATEQGPGGRAFRTGSVQVSQDIQTDPTFEPWRETALKKDIRSAAAVPLTYEGTTYGILAVYAARPLAFSRREQRGFEILGQAIGYTINATRTRRLLFAEEVVELELRLADPDEFVIEAADQLNCQLSLQGYVSNGDGSWLVYFTLSGTDLDEFIEAAKKESAVDRAQLIDGDDTNPVMALAMQSTLLDSIAALGGRVTAGSIAGSHGTLTVEIPGSADVREFIEQIRSVYSEVELLAKRDDQRPIEQSVWLTDGLVDLTERQRQALEAAYHAGYFDWPRENSAEDVADLLDISRPTMQAHLRKAERELLTTFLDRDTREDVRIEVAEDQGGGSSITGQ